jgi:hypothetical protein
LALAIAEAEARGDVLAVRRALRRIERGELLGAIHEPDLCRASSAAAAHDAALHVIE